MEGSEGGDSESPTGLKGSEKFLRLSIWLAPVVRELVGRRRGTYDLQLSPDFEVTFKMCRRTRHHSFILVARFTIGRGWAVIHPFFENLIGLIKPPLEQPLFVLLDLVLTHVVPPLRSLRTG